MSAAPGRPKQARSEGEAEGPPSSVVDTPPVFAGYQLVERLGEGASGVVYKARQHSTGQWVAVKILRPGPNADDAARARRGARFLREMRLCASLYHPHVVRLLDQGHTADDALFAVFEYVPGETLRHLLDRTGALPAPQAAELMGQVLDALVEAHAKGIVHRDLKPLNIMVTRFGEQWHAKVLDFGIGTLVTSLQAGAAVDLTLSAETLGTPRYNAPEQLRGEPPTLKSDLYAWGLILLECLTGVPVVRGQTLAEIYHEHLSPTELTLPSALLRHPLGALLRRVLSKQASERAADARDVLARLREVPLHDLVGSLADDNGPAVEHLATTRVASAQTERRQITLLAFSLQVVPLADAPSEAAFEAMEELLRDQLASCLAACQSFGGHAAGALGSSRVLYFGYPQASDRATQRAARAALDLVTRCAQRSGRLQARDGLRLELRVALHAAMMLVRPGQVPAGLANNVLDRLLHAAAAASVIVSDSAEQLLRRDCRLEPAPTPVMMEDGRNAPTWVLCAEREEDGSHEIPESVRPVPLVGRDHEVGVLARLWRDAASGHAAALLLVGEPGVGKSRLVQHFTEQVRDARSQAWTLACMPEQRHSALSPFLRWLEQQLRLDAALDPQAATERLLSELARLQVGGAETGPILASWLGLPQLTQAADLPHAPQRQRSVVLQALRDLLAGCADGPAALVIEDVHWADATSLEFIHSLLGEQRVPGLALVLTTRPELDTLALPEVLQLKGLADAEAKQLLRSMPGMQALAPAEISRLAARADGNPLFLTELARARLDPRTAARQAPEVPPSLRGVLGQALDRLGPAKATAQLAAAIGREFEPALLAQATLRDEQALRADLDQLFLATLLVRRRRVEGDAYAFRHALIRDAAYDSLTAPARAQAHDRIALALQAMPACAPARLAEHFARAGRFDRAVQSGLQAAGESLGRALHDEAASQLDAMRPWVAALPDPARSIADLDLSVLHTQALMSRFGWADPRVRAGAEHARALLAQCGTDGDDPGRRAAALWALATFHHVAGDRAQVRALVQQMLALAAVPSAGQAALQRAAHTLHGMALWIDGEYTDAACALQRVVSLPRAPGAEDAARFGLDCHCWSLAALANVRWFREGERAQARALARQAVAQAEALGHVPTLGLCLLYQAFLHQHEGDRAAAGAVCVRLVELSRRYGLPAIEAYAGLMTSWVHEDLGGLQAIMDGLSAMGALLGQTHFGSFAADVAARAGDIDHALAVFDGCLAQAERNAERYFVPELMCRQAALLAQRGSASDLERARLVLAEAGALADTLGMTHTACDARGQLGSLPLAPGRQRPGNDPLPSPLPRR
jgi:TOMM system kinase/cyclase fusion protein